MFCSAIYLYFPDALLEQKGLRITRGTCMQGAQLRIRERGRVGGRPPRFGAFWASKRTQELQFGPPGHPFYRYRGHDNGRGLLCRASWGSKWCPGPSLFGSPGHFLTVIAATMRGGAWRPDFYHQKINIFMNKWRRFPKQFVVFCTPRCEQVVLEGANAPRYPFKFSLHARRWKRKHKSPRLCAWGHAQNPLCVTLVCHKPLLDLRPSPPM